MARNLKSAYSNNKSLKSRLSFNEKYSREDFHIWLFKHLKKIKFNCVLDIGCGTGKQTFWFAKNLGIKGKVCAFDISEGFIKYIKRNMSSYMNIEICRGSMDNLLNIVTNNFSIKKFDLINCTFALYYAKDAKVVLNDMLKVLSKNGSITVCGPYIINTLLTFLSRYQKIPQISWDCLKLMDDIVLTFCKMNFKKITSHVFVNNLDITKFDDFREYYRSSTFYCKRAENGVLKAVKDILNIEGYFHIQKNSKLIIASSPLYLKD